MTNGPSKVSVVILTWNLLAWHRKAIIRAREEVPPEKGEIIVVDSGSEDGTQAYLREALKEGLIDVLKLEEENRGAAIARNIGIKLAQHPRVLLLDGDIVMPRNWVKLAGEYLDKHNEYVAITIHPTLCTGDSAQACDELEELRDIRETKTSCTNLGLYEKKFLLEIPFPEDGIFAEAGWGFEDTYQSFEADAAGYKWVNVYDRKARYLHALNSSRQVFELLHGKDKLDKITWRRKDALIARMRGICPQ